MTINLAENPQYFAALFSLAPLVWALVKINVAPGRFKLRFYKASEGGEIKPFTSLADYSRKPYDVIDTENHNQTVGHFLVADEPGVRIKGETTEDQYAKVVDRNDTVLAILSDNNPNASIKFGDSEVEFNFIGQKNPKKQKFSYR